MQINNLQDFQNRFLENLKIELEEYKRTEIQISEGKNGK